MNFSIIVDFIKANPKLIISVCLGLVFLVVNIIQAFRSKSVSKLKDALLKLPEVISSVESAYKSFEGPKDIKSVMKKSASECALIALFGADFFYKHKKLFDDAIEDILSTPQKGGQVDVSQKNEEK